MNTVAEWRSRIERMQGRQSGAEDDLRCAKVKAKTLAKQHTRIGIAREIIQEVAKQTQDQLQFHIGELVSLAMAAVMDDPYELEVEFVPRRNKTEAEISFSRDGQRSHPLSASGGGAADVASFALRVALWSLQPVRTTPVFVLDEPFRNINDPSRELHSRVAEMVKTVSSKIGIQVIMVSLSSEILDTADNVITIRQRDGKSRTA